MKIIFNATGESTLSKILFSGLDEPLESGDYPGTTNKLQTYLISKKSLYKQSGIYLINHLIVNADRN